MEEIPRAKLETTCEWKTFWMQCHVEDSASVVRPRVWLLKFKFGDNARIRTGDVWTSVRQLIQNNFKLHMSKFLPFLQAMQNLTCS
jgi:hypothetical protein